MLLSPWGCKCLFLITVSIFYQIRTQKWDFCTVFHSGAPVSFSMVYEDSLFSTFSPISVICRLFDASHFDKSEVIDLQTVLSLFIFYFWVYFLYDVKKCSNLIVLYVAAQCCLLKSLSFLHCIFLPLCHRFIDHNFMDLFLFSLFCSIDPSICFCNSVILFDYCGSVL